jgi:hypothetical protein
MNHRTAMGMGVVRQAVNMSAGYCGAKGSTSRAPHAASTMLRVMLSLPLEDLPLALVGLCPSM